MEYLLLSVPAAITHYLVTSQSVLSTSTRSRKTGGGTGVARSVGFRLGHDLGVLRLSPAPDFLLTEKSASLSALSLSSSLSLCLPPLPSLSLK